LAQNSLLLVCGFKTGGSAKQLIFEAWRKSREHADIKTALGRLSNQGRFIYLWRPEIEMNGVPNGTNFEPVATGYPNCL